MASCERLVIVSGASRGVGVGICRQVLATDPSAHVLVTARKLEDAKAVRDELHAKYKAGDNGDDGVGRAHAHKLDVTDEKSCQSLADALSYNDEFKNIPSLSLVNNAGVAYDLPWFPTPWDPTTAAITLDVNLFGAERLTRALMPLLLKSRDGRVVFISSGGGRANMMRQSESNRLQFLDKDLSWDSIKAVAAKFTEEYVSSAKMAMADLSNPQLPFLSPSGLWLQSYGFSKACMGAYCSILDRKYGPNGLLSMACSPGFIATDMSRTYAKYDELKTIDEGGKVVAWLATGDRDKEQLKGGVFYTPDRQLVSWVADPQ